MYSLYLYQDPVAAAERTFVSSWKYITIHGYTSARFSLAVPGLHRSDYIRDIQQDEERTTELFRIQRSLVPALIDVILVISDVCTIAQRCESGYRRHLL